MRVALVCSAHGFGHVARQLATGAALRARGVEPTFFTAAPADVVEADLPGVSRVAWAVDVGIAQRDSLTEDVDATLARLEERCGETAIDALAAALSGYDRVLVDVAPAALEAARRAGVPALAVGNFDWAWIYRHYPALRGWADRFAAWQAPHPAIALAPGPGMRGFAQVERVGWLGRRRPPATLPGEGRRVLVCFGGFGLADVDALLPHVPGVTWVLAPPMPRLARPDARYAEDVPFPALVAGADAVLTKPGYGILVECARAGTPIAWLDRGAFPEAPSLEAAMRARGDAKADAATPEAVAEAVTTVLSRARPSPVETDAAEVLAAMLLRERGPFVR